MVYLETLLCVFLKEATFDVKIVIPLWWKCSTKEVLIQKHISSFTFLCTLPTVLHSKRRIGLSSSMDQQPAELNKQIYLSISLTHPLFVQKNRHNYSELLSSTSTITNIIAAFGTVRSTCAVNPAYIPRIPDSRYSALNDEISVEYSVPTVRSLILVRTTSCG